MSPTPAKDIVSIFSYDSDEEDAAIDLFNLSHLQSAVQEHFGTACMLRKLAQGGYDKVRAHFFMLVCTSQRGHNNVVAGL